MKDRIQQHVIPQQDVWPHKVDRIDSCWCCPTVDVRRVVVGLISREAYVVTHYASGLLGMKLGGAHS